MTLMIYCTAALTSFSDSVSYITFLFSEWRIHFPELTLYELCAVSARVLSVSEGAQC